MIQKKLRGVGFRTNIASNGTEAIDNIVEDPANTIMLLDYKLPDIPAKQVINSLIKRQCKIPFIIMTGYGDEKLAVEMMKLGARDYLIKDAGFIGLLPSVVKRVVEQLNTERKWAEAEEQLHKLSRAIEQSPSIVAITDTHSKIEYVNPKFARLTGYSTKSTIGKKLSILKSGKHSTEFYKKLWDTINSGNEWLGEICNKKKNGALYWEFASISSIRNNDGVVTHFIKVAEDITARKIAEERLIQSEKLNALGVMTSGIAHDFNNLLAIIHGNAQLLDISHGNNNAELREGLHIICKVAKDGAETVRRMNEFTKTAGNSSQHTPLDLVDLIKHTIDFSKHRWKDIAQANGKTYNIDLEGLKPIPHIMGKASELREVFVNMINNALDAMPNGGSLSFRSWTDDNTVFASISDSGMGIPETVQKKIFDPFFSTKGAEGSGLGLSVVYGIISRHSSKIEVESRVGKGSTFILQFPITKETAVSNVIPERIQYAKSNKYHILVVDDMHDINKLLNTFLTREGYHVNCAGTGNEAIKLLKEKHFDLVLCDLGMPDVTGKDVIKAIDVMDKRPKVGLITGWADMAESLKSENIRTDFVVNKPFDLPELSRLIRKALGL